MNNFSSITSAFFVMIIMFATTNLFANNNEVAADIVTDISESFETASKAAFINSSTSGMSHNTMTSLVFFMEHDEYYTVTILDEYNHTLVSKEIKGKKGLNSFDLDFPISEKDQFTFSVYSENGVSFSGNIPHS